MRDPKASRGRFRLPRSGDQRFRIRAVDKAGNVGAWTYVRIDLLNQIPD